jgi:hypothetical protein
MAMRFTSIVTRVLTAATIVSLPALGLAQTPTASTAPAETPRAERTAPQLLPAVPIKEWKISADSLEPTGVRSQTTPYRTPQPGRRSNVKTGIKRALAGVAGGFAGFMAGGWIGARIEGNRCVCDDPGLQGFVIGAPIGAVAGAVLGVSMVK